MRTKDEFKFNDEFFLDPEIRRRGQAAFPDIWFAIYLPRLSSEFVIRDEITKKIKARFQIWGFGTLAAAVAALSLAALEPTLLEPAEANGFVPEFVVQLIGVAAAGLGVTSVLMGLFGMGLSNRKRNWLRTRLLCERIRQWRWQYFCANVPRIVEASSNEDAKADYALQWEIDTLAFISDFERDIDQRLNDALGALPGLSPHRSGAMWVGKDIADRATGDQIVRALDAADSTKAPAVEQILDAYRNVRIGAQLRYARYLARDTGPFRTHPRAQRNWLHRRGETIVILIFTLHILVILAIFLVWVPHWTAKVVNVLAVILALAALGFRAVEDGLRPSEHLGRITGYLAEVRSIGEAFGDAETSARQRDLMIALEKASYNEMVDFLQAGNRSRYVM